MPNVVRFTLSTARDLNIPGAGRFIAGVLDVDANDLKLLARTRYLVDPYNVTEVGVVDAATPKPALPAVPVPPTADPYPQYVDPSEVFDAVTGKLRSDKVPDRLSDVELRAASESLVAGQIGDRAKPIGAAAAAAFVRMAPPPSGGDDGPALRTLLASGPGIVILQRGTYLVATKGGYTGDVRSTKHCLQIPNGTAIVGQGKGVTIVKAANSLPSDSPLFLGFDPTDIEISNLTIDGNKQRFPAQGRNWGDEDEGINFKGTATRVSLRHLHIHDTGQDCIDFDFAANSVNVVIDDCLLENAGGLGIHNLPGLASRTTIRNNCHDRATAGITPWGGIDIVHNKAKLVDCYVEDNAVYQVVVDGTLGADDVQVRGCTIVASGNTRGVFFNNSPLRPVVEGCTIYGTVMTAIIGNSVTDALIRGNTIISTSTAAGHQCISGGGTGWKVIDNRCVGGHRSIALGGSDHDIRGNTISGSASACIELTFGATNCSIVGNITIGTPPDKAVIVPASGGHLISDNSLPGGMTALTGNTVRSNRGMKTEAAGSATIPDGADGVAVPHGLGNAATAITPVATVSSFGDPPVALSIRSANATTFIVSRSPVTTGALQFRWQASLN